MDCKIIEKMFQKYMDDELEPEAESEIERHISGCPDCAEKYAGLVQMKRGLSSVEDEPLPIGFHNAWTAKLQELPAGKAAGKNRFSKYMPAFAAGIAAVVIVSAALLSGVLTQAPGTANSQREIAAAQDASAAGEAAAPEMMMDEAAPEQNAAAEEGSLFMAQVAPSEAPASEAPAAEAAPASSEAAAAEAAPPAAAKSETGTGAEPLQIFIEQETFEGLISGFDELGIAYTLDGGNIFVTVTDENQEAVATVFKDNQLELCAVSGGVFEFSISE